MYDKVILENGETLIFVSDCSESPKMCNKGVDN